MQNIIRKGYIGNPAQLVTLRRVTVSEGRSRGVEIIEVRTAGGLDLDILPFSPMQGWTSASAAIRV